MSKTLPPMSASMAQSADYLYNQQLLIANGQHKLIQELGVKYSRRSIGIKDMEDGQYYIVTSPMLLVDINSTQFNLLIGSVFIKAENQILVISGCMTFDKVLDNTTFFRPLRDAGFIIKEIKGTVATL